MKNCNLKKRRSGKCDVKERHGEGGSTAQSWSLMKRSVLSFFSLFLFWTKKIKDNENESRSIFAVCGVSIVANGIEMYSLVVAEPNQIKGCYLFL